MDIPPEIAAFGLVAAAAVTGFFTYLTTRGKTKVDISQSISNGFMQLTSQLQKERLELGLIIAAQRDQIERQRIVIEHSAARIEKLERHLSFIGSKPFPIDMED